MNTKRRVFLTVFLISIFLCLTVKAASPQNAVATIYKIAGKVEIKQSGSEKWEKAKVEMPLTAGMALRTGKNAEAFIKWSTGSVVKFSAQTSMNFSELSLDKTSKIEKTTIDISEGRLFANVKKMLNKNSEFNVKTPTAIAGVRGTGFLAETSEGKTTFAVVEGQVSVTAEGVEVLLNENLQTLVESGMPPAEPAEMPEDLRQELNKDAKETSDISKEPTVEGAKETAAPKEVEERTEVINQTIEDIINQDTQGKIIEEYGIPAEPGCCDR